MRRGPPFSVGAVEIALEYYGGVARTVPSGKNGFVAFVEVSTRIIRLGIDHVCLCLDGAH